MFFHLFIHILPLLLLISCGYYVGLKGNANTKGIADLMINIVNPFVTFGAIAQINFKPEYIFLPFISYFLSAFMALTGLKIAGYFWKNNMANLIGLASVSGNTGYFAVPIILVLLPTKWFGVYMLVHLGISISEMTVGYYIACKGNFNTKETLKRLIILPPLHGAVFGFLYHLVPFTLPTILLDYWHYAVGTSIMIGMMMIGVALSSLGKLTFDRRMIFLLFIIRFILWMLISVGIILADQSYFKTFSHEIHLMIFMIGILPLPANSIAYASQLGLDAGKMALCVLLSTIFALFYVPLMLYAGDFFKIIDI